MNIDNLFKIGIRKVRKTHWHDGRYVEIGQTRGLRTSESTMHNADGTSREVGYWLLNGSDWVEYKNNETN